MKKPIAAFALVPLAATLMAQDAGPAPKQPRTAAQVFKNVQVLKDVPEDKWFGTMAFIAGSLGVTCDRCHTAAFDKDDGNQLKITARKMMRMVDGINRDHFDGETVVTCNTCHRGALMPQAAPTPSIDHWMEAAGEDASLPLAADLIARYRRAVGVRTGKNPLSQGATVQVENYSGKGPARQSSVELLEDGADRVRVTERDGQAATLFIRNGHDGWMKDAKGWRTMDEDDMDTLNQRAGNLGPDQVGEVASSKTVFKDRVYGQPAYVVEAGAGDDRKWFYFASDTGLLLRQRLFFTSIYADGSMDLEYADYRKVGGWMLPFTLRTINAGGAGLTIRHMIARKVNVATHAGEFSKTGE